MKKCMIIGLTICAATALTSLNAFAADKTPSLIAPAPAADEVVVGTQQISVNGEAVNFDKSNLSQYIFETNGVVMVPLRAVGEKMGYTVNWDGENNAVTIGSDTWEIRAYIGNDLYSGVTKIDGAVGMTAPQSYGAAPTIFEGSTFVPAKMFELLDYKYRAIGQFTDFIKSDRLIDENGQEYSNNTLIITPAQNAKESALMSLFEKNDLEVLYNMTALNMYAVKLKTPKDADGLNTLIETLEKDENISAVSKDYIVNPDNPVQMPNPFTEHETADNAKIAMAFNPAMPSYIPEGYKAYKARTMDDNFFEIIYHNDTNERIIYRTAKDSGDISGDFNKYAKEKTITVGNYSVTVKGNENISCAVWNDKDIAFSVFSDKELSEAEITNIIKSLH